MIEHDLPFNSFTWESSIRFPFGNRIQNNESWSIRPTDWFGGLLSFFFTFFYCQLMTKTTMMTTTNYITPIKWFSSHGSVDKQSLSLSLALSHSNLMSLNLNLMARIGDYWVVWIHAPSIFRWHYFHKKIRSTSLLIIPFSLTKLHIICDLVPIE